MNYQWITNLPEESNKQLSSPELLALGAIWVEKKSDWQENSSFQEFIKRLQREWAIETGIIERLYTWDRGVTEALIEHGIDSTLIAHKSGLKREEANNISNIINDQLNIVEGLFAFVKGERSLSEHYIRQIHAEFTSHQDYTTGLDASGRLVDIPLQTGVYKIYPNNPKRPDGDIFEYCPPEFVIDEMGNLVKWYSDLEKNTSPEVLAAWLHHRFTQIHPFQDGNGRVARALASLVFLKAGWFPLVIRDKDRNNYIDALEKADVGELKPLVDLFAKRQRDSILTALGLGQQVEQTKYTDLIISSALEVLRNKYSEDRERINQVYQYSDILFEYSTNRLKEISQPLSIQLSSLTPPTSEKAKYFSRVWTGNTSDNKHYFYTQIVEIAKKFDYFANLEKYRTWVRLTISTETNFEYVISFHGYGHGDTGLLAVSAFTAQKLPRDDGDGSDFVNIQPAITDVFQFNYAEPLESIKNRFSDWLESSLAMALGEWRRLLSP
jgi:Fic family protein